MKTLKTIIIISTMITALGAAYTDKACQSAVIDQTASTTANATKVEDYFPSSPTLDNFNDNGTSNWWGGSTGAFTDVGQAGICIVSNSTTAPQEGAFCLKMDYNVTAANSYAGYFSLLQSKNISAYTTLTFYVKGAAGGEFFKIEIKNNSANNNRNHAAVYINDFLDGGVTTSWQPVSIPLHNFANINDWTSAKEFVITFENSAAAASGTIYIDSIAFNSNAVDVVRIDPFGDAIGSCALGGNIGNMGGGGGSCSYSFPSGSGQYHNYRNGFASSYNVSTAYCWAGHFIMFGGGADGWTAMTHNFSSFNYLKFWIRSPASWQTPVWIKIELIDDYGSKSVYKTGFGTPWNEVKVGLGEFTGLDKSSIKQMNIIYEQQYAGNTVGLIYIDEVRFDKYY